MSTNIRAKELKRLEYEVDNDRFVVKMMLDSFLISEFDPFVLMMELNLLFFYFSIQLGVFSDNEKSTDLMGTFHLNEFTWPFIVGH